MFKTFILISCILMSFQPGKASRPLNPEAFDPQKCAQIATKGAVCLTDIWTNFGKPSAACCKALDKINDACLPSLFPLTPYVAPFLKGICSDKSGGGGGGSGALPIPFPYPFPFPFPPIGGGGGMPFPFPFPPIGGGSGGGLPFPFPGIGGRAPPPPKE